MEVHIMVVGVVESVLQVTLNARRTVIVVIQVLHLSSMRSSFVGNRSVGNSSVGSSVSSRLGCLGTNILVSFIAGGERSKGLRFLHVFGYTIFLINDTILVLLKHTLVCVPLSLDLLFVLEVVHSMMRCLEVLIIIRVVVVDLVVLYRVVEVLDLVMHHGHFQVLHGVTMVKFVMRQLLVVVVSSFVVTDNRLALTMSLLKMFTHLVINNGLKVG